MGFGNDWKKQLKKMGIEVDLPKAEGEAGAKYGNKKKRNADGVLFDSTGEEARYNELLFWQQIGEISGLQRQVPFDLVAGDPPQLICKYVADFTYYNRKGEYVVEDFKGVETDIFKLKKKMMKAILHIEILITKRKRK